MKPVLSNSQPGRLSNISSAKTVAAPTLADKPIPEISFEHLYRIGKLDASLKKNYSLEGAGLSISRNPSDWRAIAYLEGDICQFNISDNRFLDFHELDEEQRDAINNYGLESGVSKTSNHIPYRLTSSPP